MVRQVIHDDRRQAGFHTQQPSAFPGSAAELCGSSLTMLVISWLRHLTECLAQLREHCCWVVVRNAALVFVAEVQPAVEEGAVQAAVVAAAVQPAQIVYAVLGHVGFDM